METPYFTLTTLTLARHLSIHAANIRPTHRLEEDLGLDALDRLLVAMRLGLVDGHDVPLFELEEVDSVADLAALVERWDAAIAARGGDDAGPMTERQPMRLRRHPSEDGPSSSFGAH